MDAASSTTRRRRVVVVDDCADARDSLALLLEAEGLDVRAFEDACDALAGSTDFEPDAFLLDLDLAGDGALRLARDIRDDSRLQQALIVAMTGWIGPKARAGVQAAAFDLCVLKGQDPDVLVALARRG